jgi:sugar lactone lactonase YvrE
MNDELNRGRLVRITTRLTAWLTLVFVYSACSAPEDRSPDDGVTIDESRGAVKLLLRLPDELNTPDGAAMSPQGNIILSIPNFNNDALLADGTIEEPSPPRMVSIDPQNQLTTWYMFQPADMHPDTGRIGPMGCAFGPDGNLYVNDVQALWNGDHKSRLLRINVENGTPVGVDVAVEGFILANGMVWKGDRLFVTESILGRAEGEDHPLVSGVYAFDIGELANGPVVLPPYDDTDPDAHLVAVFRSTGRVGFGADGVAVDGQGNLYTSIVEDGIIYKTTFDGSGQPTDTRVLAKSEGISSADGMRWRSADNRLYVADILGNAVHAVDMDGTVHLLHQNGDTDGSDGSLDEPAEVILRGNELIVVNMDMPWEDPQDLLTNSTIDRPYTISVIDLP